VKVAVPLPIPPEHPAFAGHFPGLPVVPGAVLLDLTLLAAEALMPSHGQPWQIVAAKFVHPVGPGEAVEAQFTRGSNGGLTFRLEAGGRAVASGTLVLLAPAHE
jgi:3-hydroxyacyl-[acyl-carrier-protein] dehydratase